jgi:hypothetical protein
VQEELTQVRRKNTSIREQGGALFFFYVRKFNQEFRYPNNANPVKKR